MPLPFQLENCAAWHDEMAVKHPNRRKYHEAMAEDLMWRAHRMRQQAKGAV